MISIDDKTDSIFFLTYIIESMKPKGKFWIPKKKLPRGRKFKMEIMRSESFQHRSSISYWNCLRVFVILGACACTISIMTLIPRHNSILDQKYWMEMSIPAAMCLFLITSRLVLEGFILTQNDMFKSYRYFLKLYLLLVLVWLTSRLISFLVWSKYLGYNLPAPFIGLFDYMAVKLFSMLGIWLLSPSSICSDPESKTKLNYFILCELLWLTFTLFRKMLTKIFRKLAYSDIQCVVAILIFIFKWITKSVMSKLFNKIIGDKDERANVSAKVVVTVKCPCV